MRTGDPGAGERRCAAARTGRLIRCLLALASALTCLVQAQPLPPRIGYVSPAGCQADSSAQLCIGGQYLAGVSNVLVSGEGVRAVVLEHTRPLTPKEFTELRERLKELQAKRQASVPAGSRRGRGLPPDRPSTNAWTSADQTELTALLKKLENPPNRQGNPALAEKVLVRLEVAGSATPGNRELRVLSAQGLSNPLVFQVGSLPEFREPPPAKPERGALRQRTRGEPGGGPAATTNTVATRIGLPAVVNGQILPGEVDRYRFHARQGQKLVAEVNARALIPYLPDAVPGWFQATLGLRDVSGQELAYADDFRFNPDPVLYFEIPRDGEYEMEVKDAIYRGREDFVYRITLGELPFIVSVFPLGAPTGHVAKVTAKGWNLDGIALSPDTSVPGVRELFGVRGGRRSNRVPFGVGTSPECVEKEPNDEAGTAQVVSLPALINGRIQSATDRDVFCFEGRAGQHVVAEVHARRLNSPLDSVLSLFDPAGGLVVANDDHEDKGDGLTTHHADSRFMAVLPRDGRYCVRVAEAQQQGGPDYGYRLRLGAPEEDFELRVVPSSLSVRPGGTVPLTVYALRKDGFAGDITVVLRGAREGFSLGGGLVPAGQDSVRVTLTVPPGMTNLAEAIVMEGRAWIAGRSVGHVAVPAEDRLQAFAYHHLVPAQALWVASSGAGRQRGQVQLASDVPVVLRPGGTATVRFRSSVRALSGGQVHLELSDPPEGVRLAEVNLLRDGVELHVSCDPGAEGRPERKGNLIVQAVAGAGRAGKDKPASNARRVVVDTLPAIPFRVSGPGGR